MRVCVLIKFYRARFAPLILQRADNFWHLSRGQVDHNSHDFELLSVLLSSGYFGKRRRPSHCHRVDQSASACRLLFLFR